MKIKDHIRFFRIRKNNFKSIDQDELQPCHCIQLNEFIEDADETIRILTAYPWSEEDDIGDDSVNNINPS